MHRQVELQKPLWQNGHAHHGATLHESAMQRHGLRVAMRYCRACHPPRTVQEEGGAAGCVQQNGGHGGREVVDALES